MDILKIGQKAPDFNLPDKDGTLHKLSNYKGQWVLVYFYPRDNTPGCTKEACTLKDNFSSFTKYNAVVFGISTDSIESHNKFSDKYHLPFPILADTAKEVVNSYGVYGKKKFLGKEYMGVNRTSYLINPNGNIAKIYEKVKPADHAREVLEDIENLSK